MIAQKLRARHRAVWVALALVPVLASCSSGSGDGRSPGRTASSSPSPKVHLALSPSDGATDVAPASRVVLTATRGKLAKVAAVASTGDAVTGTLAADGTSWRSRGKLSFGAVYTVTATTTDGEKVAAGTFHTAVRPDGAHSVYASSVLGDHKTYGVGMPIILRVGRSLDSEASRAAFERTLSVRSTPATSGAWGWVNNSEVHFRPAQFWAAGSKVRVEVDSAGRSLGGGLWGRTDLTVDFSVGIRRELRADAKAHRVAVVENGRTVRTMPASLGKPEFPSSSGVMVIMDKRPTAMFDSSTYGLPVDSPGGYRTPVKYAMRLTWGGEFFHAAPWSVADQGHRNVSHGCINLSMSNAAWLFGRVLTGDPVFVTNTGTPVAVGNGWSDWTVPYSTWLTRSATGTHPTT